MKRCRVGAGFLRWSAGTDAGFFPLWAAVFFVLLLFSGLFAQDVPSDKGKGDGVKKPGGAIHIKSDRMEAMEQTGQVIFTGHVIATRDTMIIESDTLEVFYDKKPGTDKKTEEATRVVEKIVAKGNVRITQDGKVATGQKATYEKKAEKIILEGAAQVWEGQNRVKGDRITIFINEDRSVVQGTNNRKVEAVVYSAD
jgi:lipopolysaccharide export system protein LptA